MSTTDTALTSELRTIIDAALRGELTNDLARRAVVMGNDAAVAVMLAASVCIAEQQQRLNEQQTHLIEQQQAYLTELATGGTSSQSHGPHTPSGAVPPYAKPTTSKRRRRKAGARDGHPGHRRPAPKRIDRRVNVQPLTTCPHCNTPVRPARKTRKRIVEDMPENTVVEAVEYVIPRSWCPGCKKHVEPKVAAALPGATIGNRLTAMTSIFHYGLGLTIDQTRQILLSPLQTNISAGGLVDLWQRTADVLLPWYEQIAHDARSSATLHGDETSWRVDGKTHWLWCFCNHDNCCYFIDRSRGSPALQQFFTEAFEGVLIHDFWRPYESVFMEGAGDHQCCLVHLLRELDNIDAQTLPNKPADAAASWRTFARILRRLLRDGIRLRRRDDFTPQRYASRIDRINRRLVMLASSAHLDKDAARLAKRLHRHQDQIFTFLDRPEAAWENNRAEREIRPAVILRKNSQCNRSERGAATQAVLMSIYRTLKLRSHNSNNSNNNPSKTIADALSTHAATGQLPPLPQPATAHG